MVFRLIKEGVCYGEVFALHVAFMQLYFYILIVLYYDFPADVIYAWNDKDHEKWYEKSQLHID